MIPFSYSKADNETVVIEQAAQGSCALLAGGTTLIDLMKLNVMIPERLVDITGLPLKEISELPDGGLRIGAMVRNSDMAYDERVRQRYPFLSEALLSGASPQIRNMATLGGNILQRTRCPYFRDTSTPCNKRQPGSGCSAIDGWNRMHAVLGTSNRCIAAHPSDMCVPLAALDAVIRTHGPRGSRTIPFTQFHRLPGEHPEVETALEHGELIVGIDIPALPYAVHSRYLKIRDRSSYAFALVSVAAALDIRDGVIHAARLALGGVGAKPWRSEAAEQALAGQRAGTDAYRAAAEAAMHGARAYRNNGFKIELAKRAMVRTLEMVAA